MNTIKQPQNIIPVLAGFVVVDKQGKFVKLRYTTDFVIYTDFETDLWIETRKKRVNISPFDVKCNRSVMVLLTPTYCKVYNLKSKEQLYDYLLDSLDDIKLISVENQPNQEFIVRLCNETSSFVMKLGFAGKRVRSEIYEHNRNDAKSPFIDVNGVDMYIDNQGNIKTEKENDIIATNDIPRLFSLQYQMFIPHAVSSNTIVVHANKLVDNTAQVNINGTMVSVKVRKFRHDVWIGRIVDGAITYENVDIHPEHGPWPYMYERRNRARMFKTYQFNDGGFDVMDYYTNDTSIKVVNNQGVMRLL